MVKAGERSEYNESQELENLQRVFNILVKKELGKITKEQLHACLKRLQYKKLSMSTVEDMIWEVDEDCDGFVSWEEFKSMFYRVRHDKTGWEPRRLFNLVEFMMHDKVCACCFARSCASLTKAACAMHRMHSINTKP